MKYVVYTSRTGNTRLIAETIKDELGSDSTLVEFSMDMQVDKAAMLFIGYWCDKGTCSIELTQWISTLHGRKIALFGTAGFGGGMEYFNRIARTVEALLPDDNEVYGSWLCQGRMPQSVRDRYVALLEKNPGDGKSRQALENFDKASTHPDQGDLNDARLFVGEMLKLVAAD